MHFLATTAQQAPTSPEDTTLPEPHMPCPGQPPSSPWRLKRPVTYTPPPPPPNTHIHTHFPSCNDSSTHTPPLTPTLPPSTAAPFPPPSKPHPPQPLTMAAEAPCDILLHQPGAPGPQRPDQALRRHPRRPGAGRQLEQLGAQGPGVLGYEALLPPLRLGGLRGEGVEEGERRSWRRMPGGMG